MVALSDYAPLIGEAGLADKVFEWSVEEAFRQQAAWLGEASPRPGCRCAEILWFPLGAATGQSARLI